MMDRIIIMVILIAMGIAMLGVMFDRIGWVIFAVVIALLSWVVDWHTGKRSE